MKIIDLFAGCGGMSLGFQNAGFEIVAAFDNWQPAIDIYKNNFTHPIIQLDLGDIQDFSIFKNYNADAIIGGPPCQDFSSAGKRQENDRADLTLNFAEIVATIQPKIFVMENVERICSTKTLAKAIEIFKANGYGLTMQVINASLCGVPQLRKRFFMIGVLGGNDDALTPYLSENLAQKPMTIADYFAKNLDITHYYRHPRSYARRGVFSIHEPSPTIRGVNRPIPPNYQFHEGDTCKNIAEIRPLTTFERGQIQTFPSDFIWVGNSKGNLEQAIGNAVPVKLAEYVANAIADFLAQKTIKKIQYQSEQRLMFA
jgi:DNA (cytosine-5)-methyltransferase 1